MFTIVLIDSNNECEMSHMIHTLYIHSHTQAHIKQQKKKRFKK